jgi:hypothetical protein
MSNKIIIPFDGAKAADIESGGLTTFIGFERLRNLFSNSAVSCLSDDETITGFVIDETGITIRISSR